MPIAPLRYCVEPGCTEKSDAIRCRSHSQQQERMRGSAASRGYNGKWRSLRQRWLGDRPFCGDRCSGRSGQHSLCASTDSETLGTVVDHIVPHRGNQVLMWDENNLQTLCLTCHNRKSASEGSTIYSPTQGQRYVITGPSGSGKTTWVRQRAKPGDIVFDLDAIAHTVSRLPAFPRPPAVASAVLAMREGLLQWLMSVTPETQTPAVFIIVTDTRDATEIATQIKATVIHAGQSRTVSVGGE